jgi:1,4-dihydroxy-6-naphthoate synthase
VTGSASRVSASAVRTLHLAHSPDADDAFMFWAMAEGRIDTGQRRYIHELADIESLNRRALAGELEVTAVSIHAYAHLAERYALLAHGASIGDGYGPIVVSRDVAPADPQAALAGRTVAIPGTLTTAWLALQLYQPLVRSVVVPFDRIEDFVAAGRADAGLLIHEGQLTFGDRGLHRWADMGEWWQAESGLPLPLGGNVVRRDLGAELTGAIARDLKASIEYGLAHRDEALRHAQRFSRGLDARRIDRFVGMYVNAYTVDYGPSGRQAVAELLGRAHRAGLIPAAVDIVFIAAA